MKSMTGFGAGSARFDDGRGTSGEVTVEARSLNQRFLDLKLALPREYFPLEGELRRAIQERIARGRVEISIARIVARQRGVRIEIDEDRARNYVDAWRDLKKKLRLGGEIELAFLQSRADLYRAIEPSARPEAERPAVLLALDAALGRLERERSREGRHLREAMHGNVSALERLTKRMPARVEASFEDTRKRIAAKLRDFVSGTEGGRVLQDVVNLIERGDVTEEIVRLRSHLAGLRSLLGSREPAGRRVEFLLQEVGREVNTVASKSDDLELTRLALEAKSELEKLREQSQNVE